MTGLPVSHNEINRVAGTAVLDVVNALGEAVKVGQMLNDTGRGFGQANLTANFEFTADEAGLIIASLSDLANLSAIAHGTAGFAVQIGAGPLGPSDFFFNAKLLLGVNPM